MGRFIVLEVDDDEIAMKLVRKFNQGTQWRVAGFFARPHSWCECPMGGDYGSHKHFARGSKLGWWLHNIPGCKRPRKGTHQLENQLRVEQLRMPWEGFGDDKYTVRVTSLSVAEMLTDKLRK